MLKISDFTPFMYPHATNNDIKVRKHKKGEACAWPFAYSSACPAFSAAWELCSPVAAVNPVHS